MERSFQLLGDKMEISETTVSNEPMPVFTNENVSLDTGAIIEIVIKSLIYGTGVVGNILVIFLILLLREHRKVSHWYLLQLALTDFLFLQTLPFKISQDLKKSWTYPVWACKALHTVLFINYYCSILFLMIMALDRYLAVCQGLSTRFERLRSNKCAYLITFSTWILSLLLSIPVMLYSTTSGVSPGCSCTISFPKDPVTWCKANHYNHTDMDECVQDVFPSIHGDACLVLAVATKRANSSVNSSSSEETNNNRPSHTLPDSDYKEYYNQMLANYNGGSNSANATKTSDGTAGSNAPDYEMYSSGLGGMDYNHETNYLFGSHYPGEGMPDVTSAMPKNTISTTHSGLIQRSQNHGIDGNLGQGTSQKYTRSEDKCNYDDEGEGWKGFLLFNFIMMFVIPLMVIGVCYSLIIKRLTKSVAGNNKNRERKRVIVMLAVLVVLFVVCWLPYHSVHLAKIIGISGANEQGTLCTALSRITLILPYLNSALNPYLYNFLGTFKKRFRQVGQHSGVQSFLSATRLTKIVGGSSVSGQGSNSDSSRPKRSSIARDLPQESLQMKTFRPEVST